MPKFVVVDTNVFLDEPKILSKLKKVTILIPIIVVKELDKFKSGYGIIHRNSREVSRTLEKLSINKADNIKFVSKEDYPESTYADDALIEVAIKYKAKIISNDLNVRLNARGNGLKAEPYILKENVKSEREYKGFSYLRKPSPEEYNKSLKKFKNKPNHYFVKDNKKEPKKAKVYKNNKETLESLKNTIYNNIEGISALNYYQKMAMDALMDESISLVALSGSAGTGKTLLALACSIHQAKKGRYESISVGRSIIPLGKDIGALPGDAEEKTKPYLSPIYDNLDVIAEAKGDKFNTSYTLELESSKIISIQPLSFLRGRTLNKKIFIIDEAQNLTLHEMKTILTRAGKNSKIILLGDPNQIDLPGLDKYNNGLTFVIETFKGQECFSNITLERVERSELAELAVKLLKV